MKTPATIIVVNYNGGEKLRACLQSVDCSVDASVEIIVVDNASVDGSADMVTDFPRMTLLRNATNSGYGAAINIAAQRATSDVLVVLNMDVVVEPGWLAPLLGFLRAQPRCAAVNPLLLVSGAERVNAIGQDVHVTGLGFNRHLGESVTSVPSEPFEVGGIQGAAFAVRKSAFDEVGGFDESVFLYHEDVDLSWLLRLAGYSLYCVPASRLHHDYFLSMYPEKFELLERHRVAMLAAFLRPLTIVALSPMLAMTEAMAWSYSLLRGPKFMKAKARSYWWVGGHWGDVLRRRKVCGRVRRVSDWRLLRKLKWRYNFDQFVTLARERGHSRRQPRHGFGER